MVIDGRMCVMGGKEKGSQTTLGDLCCSLSPTFPAPVLEAVVEGVSCFVDECRLVLHEATVWAEMQEILPPQTVFALEEHIRPSAELEITVLRESEGNPADALHMQRHIWDVTFSAAGAGEKDDATAGRWKIMHRTGSSATAWSSSIIRVPVPLPNLRGSIREEVHISAQAKFPAAATAQTFFANSTITQRSYTIRRRLPPPELEASNLGDGTTVSTSTNAATDRTQFVCVAGAATPNKCIWRISCDSPSPEHLVSQLRVSWTIMKMGGALLGNAWKRASV